MFRSFFIFLSMLFALSLNAQEQEFIAMEVSADKYTTGMLLAPNETSPAVPLVIFIQGTGPTDRDGNQSFSKNNAFKYLAKDLAEKGIASYRYDKRIFKMRELGIREKDIRFNDFVKDAISILQYFKAQERFDKIIIAGHGEGSLIGMIAAQEGADAFISLSGAGKPIDQVLVHQIEKELPGLKENATNAFKEMREKGSTANYEPVLEFVFNPKLQPYLLSWMEHDPAQEIAKLDIPVLILSGSLDSQVSEEDAELLKKNQPNAQLVKIENMNYVLKHIEVDDDLINAKSYNEPRLPLHPELVPSIIEFIKEIE